MGKGCGKIMVIVSCLECLTWIFLFLMVEFKTYYPAPTEKWYSFFQNPMSDGLLSFLLLRTSSKRVQCSNEFMFHCQILCQVMVGDKVLCVQLPPPLRKNRLFAAQLLLCKVLGRFAKLRTGQPPGPIILKLKYHHCRAYHLGINWSD